MLKARGTDDGVAGGRVKCAGKGKQQETSWSAFFSMQKGKGKTEGQPWRIRTMGPDLELLMQDLTMTYYLIP